MYESNRQDGGLVRICICTIRCEQRPHAHMLQLIPWHVFNIPSLFDYCSLIAVTITKSTEGRFFFNYSNKCIVLIVLRMHINCTGMYLHYFV